MEYLLTIAQLYQGQDDFTNANTYLQLALGRDDTNVNLVRAVAENYSYMNNLEEAIRWYRQVLNHVPGDREATNKLIQALLWNENYEEAGRYVERA